MKSRSKQSQKEIATLVANWTLRKYGKCDAYYMLKETAEVEEGYLGNYYPFLSIKQIDEIIKLAEKIIDRECKNSNQRWGRRS